MKVYTTDIEDLKIIVPSVYEDTRGYFFESYNKKMFFENNICYDFIQDNQSKSQFGTIRGLHFQINPYAQTKLVRVIDGEILDVAVDLRLKSPTFGKHYSVILSSVNFKQFLIPRGFAHGFSVLSETATVAYKVDNLYMPEYERGIIYNDPELKIDWGIKSNEIIVSEKDLLNESISKSDIYFT